MIADQYRRLKIRHSIIMVDCARWWALGADQDDGRSWSSLYQLHVIARRWQRAAPHRFDQERMT
jgi:hypothetical protein